MVVFFFLSKVFSPGSYSAAKRSTTVCITQHASCGPWMRDIFQTLKMSVWRRHGKVLNGFKIFAILITVRKRAINKGLIVVDPPPSTGGSFSSRSGGDSINNQMLVNFQLHHLCSFLYLPRAISGSHSKIYCLVERDATLCTSFSRRT